MTIDKLKREAMRLAPTERASLARELLVSLDGLPESDIERLGVQEAARRRRLVESGETKLIPADEAFARARANRASGPSASFSQALLEFPLSCPVLADEQRKLVLEGFPYYIVYWTDGAVIEVYAVAHERRRPGYWQDR